MSRYRIQPRQRSRSSLPGLKCGTYFSGRETDHRFGLRPTLRVCSARKTPNPRISIRSPPARRCAAGSNIVLTANSISLYASCVRCWATLSINSDFVMSFPAVWTSPSCDPQTRHLPWYPSWEAAATRSVTMPDFCRSYLDSFALS